MQGSSDSVKVAVRVRPLNQREKNAGSKCIVSMKDKTTVITNPDTGDKKTFSYDHSYWSYDGFRETADGIYEPDSSSSNYADQKRIYTDLGRGVLDNAWQGYNAALFAYGQTGSGKSYSMIGYGANKGIVPIACEELFKAIEKNTEDKKQLRVFFSMLEIYNEQVRDLFVKSKPPHGGLKVRQNPKTGFYVEGIKQVPVRNYKEIEKLMESGTINRTTASTNMNATSSRSHMVITIRFEQVFQSDTGQSNTRSSDINLVDLAGSERADSSGATGDRLKEGSAINQSLSTLGNVISALADVAMGKKRVLVPYRDSVLTKLLQSALGGNSRTVMVAALSPADINYEETLSTLRYADRAKKIQNKAVVNESPTDRLIRELKEENARLIDLLKKQGTGDTSDIQRMLENNQERMRDMQMSWEQRLELARQEWEKGHRLEVDESQLKWKHFPYITNVNEDPQLSGVIKHAFCKECTIIGRSGSGDSAIEIRGLGIQVAHAKVFTDGKTTFLKPCSDSSLVIRNGTKVKEKTMLHHGDRIKLGSTNMFLYVGYPNERHSPDSSQLTNYGFDFCMTELAEHEGVSVDIQTPGDSDQAQDMSNMMMFQDFVDLMPKISEANAISEEMKRNVKFEPVIKSESSHDSRGKATGKEVIIKVTNTVSKKVWVWTKVKFVNRKDLLDELYLRHLDGDTAILTRDMDPFWDPVEDIFLGSCHVMLQSVAYSAEIDEHFTVHNYHGKEEAVVQVQLLPCDDRGKLIEGDFILEPKDLLGKSLTFLCQLPQCISIRWVKEDQSRGVYCRFSLHNQKPATTQEVWHKSYVDFGYKHKFTYKAVSNELLNYFRTHSLVLELWGKQVSEDEQLHRNIGHNIPEHLDNNGAESDVLKQLQKMILIGLQTIEQAHVCANTVDRDELPHNEPSLSGSAAFEEEAEMLNSECDALRKDNFRLKKNVMNSEGKIKLMEMKRDHPAIQRQGSRDRKASVERKPSHESLKMHMKSAETEKPPAGGLDVDFAKALRNFFRDIREVQHGLQDMKAFVTDTKDNAAINGHKKTFEACEQRVSETDGKLAECLSVLKRSAAVALRKNRPSMETGP